MPPLTEKLSRFLLPYPFRLTGFFIFIAGVVFSLMRFTFGIKPGFLEIKVFAIYCKYFDTKYFSFIRNNISEEICSILLLTGLFFITFAKEKKENDAIMDIRLRSFFLAVYANSILLFLSFIFIYGFGFLAIMVINLFSMFILFNLIYYWLKFRAIM
jgi:hypothetical protein